MCKREQPKLAYKEAGGKVNAKKKKGKAAACNDCKAAGGDCVKLLSPAGFVLAGIPDGHNQDGLNGISPGVNFVWIVTRRPTSPQKQTKTKT